MCSLSSASIPKPDMNYYCCSELHWTITVPRGVTCQPEITIVQHVLFSPSSIPHHFSFSPLSSTKKCKINAAQLHIKSAEEAEMCDRYSSGRLKHGGTSQWFSMVFFWQKKNLVSAQSCNVITFADNQEVFRQKVKWICNFTCGKFYLWGKVQRLHKNEHIGIQSTIFILSTKKSTETICHDWQKLVRLLSVLAELPMRDANP